MTTQDFMWLAIGLASLAIGGSVAYLLIRAARLVDRTEATLTKVDAKLDQLDAPVLKTMDSVGNIASSVDSMVARVDRVTAVAERAAGAVDRAADVAQQNIAPAVLKLSGIIAGVSAGARAFFTKSKGNGFQTKENDHGQRS